MLKIESNSLPWHALATSCHYMSYWFPYFSIQSNRPGLIADPQTLQACTCLKDSVLIVLSSWDFLSPGFPMLPPWHHSGLHSNIVCSNSPSLIILWEHTFSTLHRSLTLNNLPYSASHSLLLHHMLIYLSVHCLSLCIRHMCLSCSLLCLQLLEHCSPHEWCSINTCGMDGWIDGGHYWEPPNSPELAAWRLWLPFLPCLYFDSVKMFGVNSISGMAFTSILPIHDDILPQALICPSVPRTSK